MSIDILQKQGITRSLRTDEAMAWLVAHGPVVREPPVANWALRHLVGTGRIVRLRRGVYLAPDRQGRLVSPPVVMAMLAPEGYVSFYGALTVHRLTDQDAALWGAVAAERQSPVRYGQVRIEFVPWPKRLRLADIATQLVDGVRVPLASPTQAFCDTLEAPRYGPTSSELLRVLDLGLASGRLSRRGLRNHALRIGSPTLASRLGFLLELATGEVDGQLRALARTSRRWRALTDARGRLRDTTWLLLLPQTRADIGRGAR